MLNGDLEDELAEKWSWDREYPHPDLNPEYPRTELCEMLDDLAKL
jgi:hypothetical protein